MNKLIVHSLYLLLISCCLFSGCASRKQISRTERANLFYEAGVGYINQGEPGKAVEHLKNAHEYDSNNPLIMHALGLAYFQLGVPDTALNWIKQASTRLPNDPEIHNNLASIYIFLKQYQQAVFHSSKAIDNPDYRTPAAAYFNRGISKIEIGDADGAENDFLAAIRHEPMYDMPRIELGRIYIRKHRLEDALRMLTTAINTNPRNPEAYLLRGEAFWQRGYVSRAESDFRKILELPRVNPAISDQAHDWLDRLR